MDFTYETNKEILEMIDSKVKLSYFCGSGGLSRKATYYQGQLRGAWITVRSELDKVMIKIHNQKTYPVVIDKTGITKMSRSTPRKLRETILKLFPV